MAQFAVLICQTAVKTDTITDVLLPRMQTPKQKPAANDALVL
jgi:hypothetical protein